ncbi:3-keto-5-aminohexanoate cleavage protein [Vibrio sp. vnigr-6D03]|uniref:bifunctional sugar phosphate isomerase/epimerase/4-hydroxyphenylpyruvate dioxygenase family protein n=1 Tax=Vibrio sp. vnigr-6D03 TaxID=2058088 RepID=UPI000C32BFC1|nr:sugar phosphate isomerase/epimerase and 4-hydroxyphenylpyruvate domain-containing protein [Vibrio sp. vnigr-6D03]PKF78203.1 3-keto-5-aminohexanoate cleavage protein [Vibrio sp. vnigr-6D03]
MLYSIATICLSGSLRQKIEASAKAGFRGIEIFEADLINHNGSIKEIRSMLDDNGLSVVAYQPLRDFEGLPAPYRDRIFQRANQKFDIMDELGTDLLMVCSSCSPHALGGIQRAADDFSELGSIAEKREKRVAYEALAWGKHVFDYRDSWEIVRRANHEKIGVCLDTFHIFSRGTEIDSMLNIPGEKIFLVQAADAPRLSMDHLSWSRHFRCFPGQGELPLDQFMKNLHATGYDGPFSLEIFNDQFRSSSPEKTAIDGYRSLVFANNRSEDIKASKPANRQDHVAGTNVLPSSSLLPKTLPPSEVQFIEFALNIKEREALTLLLGNLGFYHAGTHKKKNVELWRQGSINLVMNLEPDSFAQQYHQKHGASVCAVGLTCTDVPQLLDRANKLCYQIHGNTGSDTHGIPAIQGPGESLIYLVDESDQPAHWEREFEWNEPAELQAYLTAIDHIATTMPYEEMLHSILLYRAMFNMVGSPSVSLTDPSGLVKSQAMQTPDNRVAFTLNSSQASRTVSNKIMDTYAGTGVNHIAFSTRDIFAMAEKLASLNVKTMPVTDNYYDDLATRFGLSSEQLSLMRRFNILYDEDEHGVFYQLYSELFEGRFCFEIVQRDGYRGFGAPNSQIRMTMQAKELESL